MYKRLIVAIIWACLLVACSEGPKESPLQPGSVVLALGDSLTFGAGVSEDQAWPTLLGQSSGWVVENGGVNGDTSEMGLKRLPALLDEHRPELVLVTLGGNDMLRQISEDQTIKNVEQIIASSRIAGARVVLLATPRPSIAGAVFKNLSAPEFYREIATAQQVPLIEDAISDVLSDPLLKGDPLHPNAEGHVLLERKISNELREFGFLR